MAVKDEVEVQVRVRVNARALWQGVFGSGVTYAGYPWWHAVRYTGAGSWEVPGVAIVYTINPDDPDAVPVGLVVTLESLRTGLEKCIELRYQPWEGLDWLNPEEYDSVAADLILQCAIWGEAVYG
jgi:hypothetical protein